MVPRVVREVGECLALVRREVEMIVADARGRDACRQQHRHGILAGEAQGPLMFHAPIAYCETASVFGEMTTFTFLKERLTRSGDKNSLLALIMAKIDTTLNTVVRQIGFSNFEWEH